MQTDVAELQRSAQSYAELMVQLTVIKFDKVPVHSRVIFGPLGLHGGFARFGPCQTGALFTRFMHLRW